MSLFRKYKDRRASEEGWPYYYNEGRDERVHHAQAAPAVDPPDPVETLEEISATEALRRLYKRMDEISLRDAGRRK